MWLWTQNVPNSGNLPGFLATDHFIFSRNDDARYGELSDEGTVQWANAKRNVRSPGRCRSARPFQFNKSRSIPAHLRIKNSNNVFNCRDKTLQPPAQYPASNIRESVQSLYNPVKMSVSVLPSRWRKAALI